MGNRWSATSRSDLQRLGAALLQAKMSAGLVMSDAKNYVHQPAQVQIFAVVIRLSTGLNPRCTNNEKAVFILCAAPDNIRRFRK
jgi:hypothetical protein